MRITTEKEVNAVIRLDGPARFVHFVKRVVDAQVAWGLWDEGWALMENDEGVGVFPLWPAQEYAALHRDGAWSHYGAREIPLEELLGALLPKLAERGVLPGIFPVPGDKGILTTPAKIDAALREEMRNYE